MVTLLMVYLRKLDSRNEAIEDDLFGYLMQPYSHEVCVFTNAYLQMKVSTLESLPGVSTTTHYFVDSLHKRTKNFVSVVRAA